MSPARRVVQGGAAGAAATVVMSVVMAAGHRLGLLGEPPPRVIARAAMDAAGTDEDSPGAVDTAATLAHLGFGVGAGAVYGALRPALPAAVPGPVAGAAFALAVWAVSYSGWVPALGILPPPSEDRPGRQPTMVLAHLVFGAALGAAVDRADRADR